MTYRIAADTIHEPESRPLRAGGAIYRRNVTPGQWTHAFEEGSDETLCGRQVASRYTEEFPDVRFETVARPLRCRECMDLAEA